jgi:phage-related protein
VDAGRQGPKLGCRFYRSDTDAEPVRAWLVGLAREVRVQIGSDIGKVQWRWPVGRPLVGALGDGLYEVRTTHEGNAYRVLFSIVESDMVLLHGFQKKTRRTPRGDLELARRRMR